MGPRHPELTGQKFGRLTVIRYAFSDSWRAAHYDCRCECGTDTTVKGGSLRSGTTSSCGCLQKESIGSVARRFLLKHGHALHGNRHYLYKTWEGLRQRCNNPNIHNYKNYGGRGISVCPEWDDFQVFLDDMGDRPEGMSIDRIDNDGNYEPNNCQWATPVQQRSNRRGTR